MKEKFSLDFTVMNRQQQRIVERERGLDVNPWTQFPRIITSMHYLKQPAELDHSMMALQRTWCDRRRSTCPIGLGFAHC